MAIRGQITRQTTFSSVSIRELTSEKPAFIWAFSSVIWAPRTAMTFWLAIWRTSSMAA